MTLDFNPCKPTQVDKDDISKLPEEHTPTHGKKAKEKKRVLDRSSHRWSLLCVRWEVGAHSYSDKTGHISIPTLLRSYTQARDSL